MTRRDLIQKIIIGGTTVIIVPSVLQSCSKDDSPGGNNPPPPITDIVLDLTNPSYSVLNNPGGSLVHQGIIIANTGTGYVALSSTCTHMGCTVGYNSTAKNFPCPCHGSLYSLSGSVINGPATAGLRSYPVSRTGDILTVDV